MLSQFGFVFQMLRWLPLLALIRAALLGCGPVKRRRTTPRHEAGVVLFWLYLVCVGALTVNLGRVLRGLFERSATCNLTPLAGIAAVAATGDLRFTLVNVLGNVLLFLPLGLLLPLLWRGWTGPRVFLLSLTLSGGIEFLQFYTGRSADVDDILLNVAGGVAGFVVYCAVRAFCPGAAAKFRLRDSREGAHRTALSPAPRAARPIPAEVAPYRPAAALYARPAPAPAVRTTSSPSAGYFAKRRAHRTMAALSAVAVLFAVVVGAALAASLSGGAGSPGPGPARHRNADSLAAPAAVWQPETAERAQRSLTLTLPTLHSPHVLLASADTGEILFAQEADARLYPASMTKTMTALLALERIEDLQEPVLLREELFAGIWEANAATAGFLPGEEVRAIDLIYGAMLPSGAECAIGLAEHIAGSEAAFAGMMNDRARTLGMENTRFVNATGLHHPDHYSTAGDMARLLRCALENETLRAVMASERYSTAPTNLHPDGVTFASTLYRGEGAPGRADGILRGGKTGYTDEAGQCLASFAELDGERFLLITAGAVPEDFRAQQLHLEDALAVYGALAEASV